MADQYEIRPTQKTDGFNVMKPAHAVVNKSTGKEVAAFHVESQAVRHKEFKESSARPLR